MRLRRRERQSFRFQPLSRWSVAEIAAADVVVFNGKIWKNRWGISGDQTSIPDGCYRLLRLDTAVAA